MHLTVFEDAGYRNLLPLVYSRAAFDLRCGCDRLLEKIERAQKATAESLIVREPMAALVGVRRTPRVNQFSTAADQLWVNGRVLLREQLDLPENTAAWRGDTLLAARIPLAVACKLEPEVVLDSARLRETLAHVGQATIPESAYALIDYPWQLVHENEVELVRQIGAMGSGNAATMGLPGVHLVNPEAIHIGEGVRIKPAVVLDAESGPIHIADGVTIHPHATIQGPCYIGENTIIQPGACIRTTTSIGPVCKIGGEIEGTIFHSHSNKQHDGFLGHSYVGKWVNLGADTVNSDLKNTYGSVNVRINGESVDSGQTFVGACIGDHSKTGINTTLPTGCVIGFSCSVTMSGVVPTFVPSFSWLTDAGRTQYDLDRALAVAKKVMARRSWEMSEIEETRFRAIVDESGAIERSL